MTMELQLLVIMALCMHACSAGVIVEAESKPFVARSECMKQESAKQRIAVVNGVSFHFEVLAGLLHILKPYEKSVEVFLSPWIQKENYDGKGSTCVSLSEKEREKPPCDATGAKDLFKWSKAKFRSTNANLRSLPFTYGLCILVSTDYELDANRRLLEQMQPRTTLAIVHNSDYSEMGALLNLSKNITMVTLSPHVADSLAKSTGRPVDWFLPVSGDMAFSSRSGYVRILPNALQIYPLRPDPDCTTSSGANELLGSDCLKGFSMQGKFSNLRR